MFTVSSIPLDRYLCGGDEEDRTPDPLLARQVLSQLSYTPIVELNFATSCKAKYLLRKC